MAAIFAVAGLDRHILSISLETTGRELVLTDMKLGLLSGRVFAVVFMLSGFPIAKLAARGNRSNIVAASATIWNLISIATGAAQSFVHPALALLGGAVGQAGVVSPAPSMISDLIPPERRTTAMATFIVGANVGILLAFLIGGVAGKALCWRWAFVVARITGAALAGFFRFTITEPQRDKTAYEARAYRSLLVATQKTIWRHRSLFHAKWGLAITGIATLDALAWNPTFIIREH